MKGREAAAAYRRNRKRFLHLPPIRLAGQHTSQFENLQGYNDPALLTPLAIGAAYSTPKTADAKVKATILVVQAAWRGAQSRKELAKRKRAKAKLVTTMTAVQAIWRGMKGREAAAAYRRNRKRFLHLPPIRPESSVLMPDLQTPRSKQKRTPREAELARRKAQQRVNAGKKKQREQGGSR